MIGFCHNSLGDEPGLVPPRRDESDAVHTRYVDDEAESESDQGSEAA